MTLSRDLLREVRGLDEFDLRRLMLFVGELVSSRVGPVAPALTPLPEPSRAGPKVSFRQQYVRCGKAACSRCPHGPYWYAFWREGARVRSRYVGKELPESP